MNTDNRRAQAMTMAAFDYGYPITAGCMIGLCNDPAAVIEALKTGRPIEGLIPEFADQIGGKLSDQESEVQHAHRAAKIGSYAPVPDGEKPYQRVARERKAVELTDLDLAKWAIDYVKEN